MKVLLFRTNGNIVNLNTYNLQELGIAKALQMRGIDCDIMYYGGNKCTHEDILEYKGRYIKIIWARGISIAGNGVFFGVKRIIDEYDIVQVCEYDQFYSRYIAFFSKYKDKACLSHGPYYNTTNKKYNLKIRLLDILWLPKHQKHTILCFAKSRYAKDFLEKRGFHRVTVTGVGLDIDRFKDIDTIPTTSIIDEIKAFKGEDLLLLYIGQISDRRNTMFLIDLMEYFKKTNFRIKLAIIGNGDDSYRNECMNRIKNIGLKNMIFYKEKITQDQVPLLYKQADFFLLPTKYEIFGMVMLEAMYFGVPVITTDNGGSATVIENGDNGYILPLSIKEWAATIVKLNDDKNKYEKIVNKAYDTIVQKFTWMSVTEGMVQGYYDIINGEL